MHQMYWLKKIFWFSVYKWEGFGKPLSNAGSLSSLDSFGHVDDLDFQAITALTCKSTSSESSSEDEEMASIFEDGKQMPFHFIDSWV